MTGPIPIGIVLSATGSPELWVKAVLAREHGADHIILYRDEDVAARVLDITGGEGVHAIFNGVGKDTARSSRMGHLSGSTVPFDLKALYPKNVKYVYPSATLYVQQPENGRDYGQEVADLLASGAVNPIISNEYPLTAEGVAQAQKDLAEGRSVGTLLIKVASD